MNKIDAKFSEISKEFTENNRKLKQATQKQLKKHFLNCFEPTNENYFNKTIIGFSLYKLNKDNDVRKLIVANLDKLHLHFEGVAYYLKTHFEGDADFDKWVKTQLKDDNILFQHIVALIFKNFPSIPFEGEIFEKHYQNNKQFWLTKYYLLNWLFINDKGELIKVLKKDENYYVNRKLDRLRISLSEKDIAIAKWFCKKRKKTGKKTDFGDNVSGKI